MNSLFIGLLVAVIVLLVVLIGLIGVNIYLTYRTLVRPEAPCYAGAMAALPKYMAAIDSDHPSYNQLLTKIRGGKEEKMTDKSPAQKGQYL